MKPKTNLLVPAAVIVAAAIAAPSFFSSNAHTKQTFPASPAQIKAQQERAQREDDARAARMEPAVDLAVKGDYAGALAEFKKLDALGGEQYPRQEALCLLHLGRPSEGLRVLRSATAVDMSFACGDAVRVALAVAAHDESALMQGLAVLERNARVSAAPPKGKEAAQNATISPHSIAVSRRLMEAAIELGRRYDRQALELVGDEAVRRGATDAESLIQYGALVSSNGDLRKARALFETASRNATDDLHRKWAEGNIYDLTNYIAITARKRSVEDEEARQHKKNEKFYRQAWN